MNAFSARIALPARTLLDVPRSFQKITGGLMLPEKGTTVYLKPHLRAQAEDAAVANRRKLSPFLGTLIDQMLNWRFLSGENHEFIRQISRALGEPWDTALVLNRVVAHVRNEVSEGRLVLGGFFFHQPKSRKNKLP